MASERVIILGHTGFIGSRVLAKMQAEPERFAPVGLAPEGFDLSGDVRGSKAAEEFTPETTVVMCAAIKRQLGDTADIYLANTQIIVNFANLIAARPVKRVVYLSSGAVYGEDIENLAITEETPFNPRSYYGLSKVDAEWILKKTTDPLPTGLGMLRPATIYGPGDVETAYGPSGFLNAAVKGEAIRLWGDGSELRELIFIDDVVDAIVEYAASGHEGPLNLVAGKSYTFQDALKAVEKAVGTLPEITSRERSKSKVDNAYDNALLRKVLPGIAFTPLDEGVAATYRQRYAKAGAAAND